jgi:hypothetical protein
MSGGKGGLRGQRLTLKTQRRSPPASALLSRPATSSPLRESKRLGVDAEALYRHIQRMNKLRSAASTTTATAYGGSPAGCAR